MHEQSQKEKAALNKKVCCACNHSVHLHLDQTSMCVTPPPTAGVRRGSLYSMYIRTYNTHSHVQYHRPVLFLGYLLILYMNTQVTHFSEEASKLRAVVAEYETVKTDLASTKAR